VFHLDFVYVYNDFQMFFRSFRKCFRRFHLSFFLCMLQLLHLDASKVDQMLHIGCVGKAVGSADDVRGGVGDVRGAIGPTARSLPMHASNKFGTTVYFTKNKSTIYLKVAEPAPLTNHCTLTVHVFLPLSSLLIYSNTRCYRSARY
jgi:hypothetical protein